MSREAAYAALLAREGADAFVLTSEPAVRHAAGVHVYTMRLIPQRPVACVVAPPGPPVVVACVLEEDQLRADHPGLELRTYLEFGDDPWAHVAEVLGERGAATVLVEDGIPAAWLAQLHDCLPDTRLVVSYDLAVEPRIAKDEDEIALVAEASCAAERAIAAGAAVCVPGATEREVAGVIVGAFRDLLPGRTGEVEAMVVAPQSNRSMHHLPGATAMPPRGPVRIGIVGRVDGYWLIVTRMLVLGDDPAFEEAYRRYLAVYEAGLASLVAGSEPAQLWRGCARTAAENGFELTTLKIGHGTGLDFRERPWISEFDDMPLAQGMVLAYDFGLESEDGTVLHVEDRVLVTEGGPRRLTDGWDLSDLRRGFETLL
jgi:Xaa-Pro dipeptidase